MKRANRYSKTDDSEYVKSIQKIAKAGFDKALRIAKGMGPTVKIIRNNEIIEILPNSNEKIIKKIETIPLKIKGFKEGIVLCKKTLTKRLRVFAGPNGLGKSTLYKEFSAMYQTGYFINADDIEHTLLYIKN